MRYCNHIMIIKDEGYVLSAKKYGEKALIVTLLTKSKGKIAGFVSEGAGKKNRGLFQPGNKLFLRRLHGWMRICGGCSGWNFWSRTRC